MAYRLNWGEYVNSLIYMQKKSRAKLIDIRTTKNSFRIAVPYKTSSYLGRAILDGNRKLIRVTSVSMSLF